MMTTTGPLASDAGTGTANPNRSTGMRCSGKTKKNKKTRHRKKQKDVATRPSRQTASWRGYCSSSTLEEY